MAAETRTPLEERTERWLRVDPEFLSGDDLPALLNDFRAIVEERDALRDRVEELELGYRGFP